MEWSTQASNSSPNQTLYNYIYLKLPDGQQYNKTLQSIKNGHYMRAATSYKGAVNKTTIEAYTH